MLILTDLSEEVIAQLKALSPRLIVTKKVVGAAAEIDSERWAETDILYTTTILPEPEAAPRLRWIQSHFAGVDALMGQPFFTARPDVTLTTTSGIHASSMAEFTFALILAFARKLPTMVALQKQAAWTADRFEHLMPIELRGATLGILGYGSIGRGIARLAAAFGMSILATKRDVKHTTPANTYEEPTIGNGDMPYVDRLYPPEATRSMLSLCDFIVVALPLTPETRGVVNAEMFAAMKRSAIFINVARGGIVDEAALIAALQNGQIAGAGLDVFAQEPLPPRSPLWAMDNVIVSPHVSGNYAGYGAKAGAVFVENMRRYLNKSELLNQVDVAKGY
ncbi:MAG TPA: D-2-hydroxyacid dehydrogenase [Aggregatilineales bacterium]|nr:D-2-hydroxyacid dehydrogenase [Anaerolineales bacterium]HRE47751.1 D-2-hydroxyacid dehydrogenase [Aggregatilineales bacterium]